MTIVANVINSEDSPDQESVGNASVATRRAVPTVRLSPTTVTYMGVAITAVGFIVIAYAWSRVAGLANVALQLPYVVSGGFVGLGLVLVGLTVINIAALRDAETERRRHLDRLSAMLSDRETGTR